MASGRFLADGSTDKFIVGGGSENVHIAVEGTFGGGNVNVEKVIAGEVFPLRDGGTAIVLSAPDDSTYLLKYGDVILLTLSGSTTPVITWSVTGN
ncbi:MAG: hypothetical protein JKX97_00420 [Candidatus Lindowbacteria bacterium]|nr:hypothetical protein [Candidatus Lindowbacteria bacterium]